MGFNFDKPKKPAKEALTEDQEAFRERDKKEKKRLLDEGDTEYWFCVCFSTENDLKAFQKLIKSEKKEFNGDDFREKTARFAPESVKRQFVKKTDYGPGAIDVFEDVEYTGIFEIDTYSEIVWLGAALEDIEVKEQYPDATESAYYIAVYFESREDKEDYLKKMGILPLGDKYIDGSKWLKKI